MPSRDDELGGLWLKTAASGTKYMSGRLTIDGHQLEVVVFRNSHKQEGERTPDYRVYRSQPRDGAPPPVDRNVVAMRAQAPSTGRTRDDLDDDIPF